MEQKSETSFRDSGFEEEHAASKVFFEYDIDCVFYDESMSPASQAL